MNTDVSSLDNLGRGWLVMKWLDCSKSSTTLAKQGSMIPKWIPTGGQKQTTCDSKMPRLVILSFGCSALQRVDCIAHLPYNATELHNSARKNTTAFAKCACKFGTRVNSSVPLHQSVSKISLLVSSFAALWPHSRLYKQIRRVIIDYSDDVRDMILLKEFCLSCHVSQSDDG